MKQFDLIVIGGGSGGVRAARIAAEHGAKVAICEEYRYGGTCVIRGCVPKKLMVTAAHFHEDFIDSQSYGWQTSIDGFDWNTFINNKDKEIDRLNGIYEKLLQQARVVIYKGRGKLRDANTVEIGDSVYCAKTILIATGGTPFLPQIEGIEHAITSNEVFHLDKQPERIMIVGGGYIAVEFAGIFNGLGTNTQLVYRGPQVLRGFDEDIRQHLGQEISKKGVELILNSNVVKIAATDSNEKVVSLDDGSKHTVDSILYATGRIPNTTDLGLQQAEVKLGNKQEILVDKNSKTNIGSIYAVGDVTDRIALTPVAILEGHAFADTLFGNAPRQADHRNVASAVFSQPPIATVGLTVEQARSDYNRIDTYHSEFRILKHSITDNQQRTLMKLIVDRDTDKVIGAHMIGTDAPEIIQGIAIAIKAGATKADFDSTVGIHPTSAEEFCTMKTRD